MTAGEAQQLPRLIPSANRGVRWRRRGGRLAPAILPVVALAAAMITFVALYLYLLRDVGLANDEWTFMLYRSDGFQAIVLPYNNGPVVGEILLYRLWSHTAGVGHHWVLSLVFVGLHCAVVGLVYGMVRTRIGGWGALGAALLVLVLGRAWETILFPATLTFVAPTLAGCAAWFALDRQDGWSAQIIVGVLLAIAAVTGGLGPALLLGLLVEICLRRRWRWLVAIAMGALPLAAWYAGEAASTGTHIATNLPHLPLWALKHLVAAAAAVFGLPPAGGVAVLALAAALIGLWRRRAPAGDRGSGLSGPAPRLSSPRAAGLLVTLLAAVLTIGAARAADTPATSSRYLYFSAVVMVLLGCELLREIPALPARLTAAAGTAVTLVAIGLGVQQLRDGKVFYLEHADRTRASMGAMRLAHGPPLLYKPGGLAYTPGVLAAFVRRFGSAPIDTERQLAQALPQSRAAADQVLAQADIRRPGAPRACPQPSDGVLPSRRDLIISVATHRQEFLQLVRFSPPGQGVWFPVRPPRVVFGLHRDQVSRPWRLLAPAGTALRLCR